MDPFLRHCNLEQQTPLHIACIERARNNVQLLLNRGANLSAKDKNQQTPLDLALEYDCFGSHYEIVEMIRKKKESLRVLA